VLQVHDEVILEVPDGEQSVMEALVPAVLAGVADVLDSALPSRGLERLGGLVGGRQAQTTQARPGTHP
jgi:hypothetical protein